MFDVTLHVGIEHPNLLWLLVTAILAFGAGVLTGWFGRQSDSTAAGDPAETPSEE